MSYGNKVPLAKTSFGKNVPPTIASNEKNVPLTKTSNGKKLSCKNGWSFKIVRENILCVTIKIYFQSLKYNSGIKQK